VLEINNESVGGERHCTFSRRDAFPPQPNHRSSDNHYRILTIFAAEPNARLCGPDTGWIETEAIRGQQQSPRAKTFSTSYPAKKNPPFNL